MPLRRNVRDLWGVYSGGSRGWVVGVASPPPPPWEDFKLVWLPMSIPFSYHNISSSPIDHYKKTVVIPQIDSLIIQMQDFWRRSPRRPSALSRAIDYSKYSKAAGSDEVKGMLFWEKNIPFLKSLGIEVRRWKTLWRSDRELPTTFYQYLIFAIKMLYQTSIAFWSLSAPYRSQAQKLSDFFHW